MAGDHSADGPATTLEVVLERAVAGGVVLGRDHGGRVALVRGGLPGERVGIDVDEESPTLLRGAVRTVLDASARRVDPECANVGRGCGGCDLQHASRSLQREMRAEVVRDALQHTARLPGSVAAALTIEETEEVPVASRTTLRTVVTDDGTLGLRRFGSHDRISLGTCPVAHPVLAASIREARFEGPGEVTLRGSVATGEVIALPAAPRDRSGRRRGRAPVARRVPDGMRVLDGPQDRTGPRWITETVAGVSLRVSARSFFQSGPGPAAALGRAVRRALGGFDPHRDRLVDLYGGVGLFTSLLGAEHSEVIEWSSPAVADARVNTAQLGSRVTRSDVNRWRPAQADAVVADPARRGLGSRGVDAVVATGADTVALVSCDPASMARDLAGLYEHGYVPGRIELVDMFPHTHHVEAVSTLRRTGPRAGGG